MDGVQKDLPSEGLGEKLHGARLHSFHRHGNVAVACDKDNRYAHIAGGQVALKVETTDSGQSHIQHEAGGRIRARGDEELLGRTESLCAQTHGLQEILDGRASRGVVVHDVHHGLFVGHYAPSLWNGSRNWKMAPSSELAAHSRPRCASIIVRLIDNPMPRPSGLVVKKAPKMRSGSAMGRPGPVSRTVTTTASPSRPDRICNSRGRPFVPLMASIALTTRLRITCCNCTRSPNTSGKAASN